MNTEVERIATNLRRGVLEFCVLGLLASERRYGLDLAQSLQAIGLIAGDGSLYPLLTRLREAGYVTTDWSHSDDGRPRRYYEVTDAGRRFLGEFQTVWAPLRDHVDDILEGTRA